MFKQVADLRMELLPNIYSNADTSAENRVMMKPMAYLYPHDEKIYSIWDQYFFGNAFLVAPNGETVDYHYEAPKGLAIFEAKGNAPISLTIK